MIPEFCRRWSARIATIVVALLFAADLTFTAAEGAAATANAPGLERCARAPTVQCVLKLAIDTAKRIDDHYVQARAFVRVAAQQRTVGDTQGARESLFRALTAAATIDGAGEDFIRSSTPICRTPNLFVWLRSASDLQARASIDIAREQATMGDTGGALRTLSRSLALVEHIQDSETRAAILCGISAAQAAVDEDSKSQQTLLRALDEAERIVVESDRAGILVDIALAQAETGHLQRVADIALKVRAVYARAGAANHDASSFDLRSMAAAQATAGDFAAAFAIAKIIGGDSAYIHAWTLADIASEQVKAGDIEEAFAIAQLGTDARFQIMVVAGVGEGLAAAGHSVGATRAAAMISEIEDAEAQGSVRVEAEIYRSRVFSAMAKAQVAAGELGRAMDILEEIESPYPIMNAAKEIAKAQTASGDLEGAHKSVWTVCNLGLKNHKCAGMLADLASAHAKSGKRLKARMLVMSAKKIATRLRFLHRIPPLVSVWSVQLQIGDAEGAEETFAAALHAAKHLDRARTRAIALAELGLVASKCNELRSAKQAFAAAMMAADEVGENVRSETLATKIRAEALTEIGGKRVQAGDLRGARESFSRAIAVTGLHENAYWRATFLANIASILDSSAKGVPQGVTMLDPAQASRRCCSERKDSRWQTAGCKGECDLRKERGAPSCRL